MLKRICFIISLSTLSTIFTISSSIKILKLGGGVITDKSAKIGVARKDVIGQIAKEISQYDGKIILVNGAGSFGHPLAKKYNLKNQFCIDGTIETHNSVRKLNQIIVNALIENGVKAISVDPMSCIVCQGGRIESMQVDTIKEMIKNGFVPVLFGDMVMDTQKGACILSGDQIMTYLAKKLETSILGFGSIENGVYDENKRIIPKIDKENFKEIKKQIGESKFTDSTGGMLGKVNELLETPDIVAYIFNAEQEGNITKFLNNGKVGTQITS